MKSNVRDWLIGVAGCLVLAAAWGILAVPGTAVADKATNGVHNHGGDNGGGDETTSTPCLMFDDVFGDNIQSDGTPYCHDKKAKIEVSFTSDGHLLFDTNNSNKTGAGRSLFIDFGEEIEITDREGNSQFFQSTTELDLAGIEHDVNMSVGAFQGDFNMLEMFEGETRTDVNLQMRLFVHFPGQRQETGVRIVLAPEPIANERHCLESDSVTVTYLGVIDGLREWRVATKDNHDACVTQNEFEGQDVTVGLIPIQFGFTVTAP